MEFNKPQQEHEWLQKLVGRWRYVHECVMQPGEAPQKFAGTDTVRTLGGMWVICEGEGETPGGGTSQSIITVGYDPAKGRFVGTFICNVMHKLWIYEGQLDAAGKKLSLHAEGPSFTDPHKTVPYIDAIEWIDDDHRTLTSQVQGDDGQWTQFMQAHYHRIKD